MELIAISLLAIAAYLLYKQNLGTESDSVGDLGGYVDTSSDSLTVKIAQAIATAEGFYVPGSRPARNHNPGDMTADLIGRSIGTDGNFVVYASDHDGWLNLYAQINSWLNGTSRYHSQNSTIADIAGLGNEVGYTSTEQTSWAQNVANYLGVDLNTPIGEIA